MSIQCMQSRWTRSVRAGQLVHVGHNQKKVAIKDYQMWSETVQSRKTRHQRRTQHQAARSRKDVTLKARGLTNNGGVAFPAVRVIMALFGCAGKGRGALWMVATVPVRVSASTVASAAVGVFTASHPPIANLTVFAASAGSVTVLAVLAAGAASLAAGATAASTGSIAYPKSALPESS